MTDSPPPGAGDPDELDKVLNRYLDELSRLDLDPPAAYQPPDFSARGSPTPLAPGASAAPVMAAPEPPPRREALLGDLRDRIRAESRGLKGKPEVPSVLAPPESPGDAEAPARVPSPALLGLFQGLVRRTSETLKSMAFARAAGGTGSAASAAGPHPMGEGGGTAAPATPGAARNGSNLEEKVRVLTERQSLLQNSNEDLKSQVFSLTEKLRKLREITQSLIEVSRNRRPS